MIGPAASQTSFTNLGVLLMISSSLIQSSTVMSQFSGSTYSGLNSFLIASRKLIFFQNQSFLISQNSWSLVLGSFWWNLVEQQASHRSQSQQVLHFHRMPTMLLLLHLLQMTLWVKGVLFAGTGRLGFCFFSLVQILIAADSGCATASRGWGVLVIFLIQEGGLSLSGWSASFTTLGVVQLFFENILSSFVSLLLVCAGSSFFGSGVFQGYSVLQTGVSPDWAGLRGYPLDGNFMLSTFSGLMSDLSVLTLRLSVSSMREISLNSSQSSLLMMTLILAKFSGMLQKSS